MKKILTIRTIKPPPGKKGKPREGIIGLVSYELESEEEIREELKNGKWLNSPDRLKRLITGLQGFLKDYPPRGSAFYITDNGEWKLVPPEYKELGYAGILEKLALPQGITIHYIMSETSPLIEPASPEYFAYRALRNAEFSLSEWEKENYEKAMGYAMDAVLDETQRVFALRYEPRLAARIAIEKGPKGASKTKQWANELAKKLRIDYDKEQTTFENLWKSIPEDEGNRYAGFEVVRVQGKNGKEELKAYRGDKEQSMPKSTFRTNYFSKSKKN